jgi:hypothetical protein
MGTMFVSWRPSTVAAACAPHAVASAAQAHVLGQPAVRIRVRTAPTFRITPAGGATPKINNYINGIDAASAVEGAAKTSMQLVLVKGGDARGIPPRGTPV